MNRKFFDMVKKKYKDDLMDNLLQEEYSKASGSTSQSQGVSQSKAFKKKKKKVAQPEQVTFDSCESSFTEQTGHLITTINESPTAEDTPTED